MTDSEFKTLRQNIGKGLAISLDLNEEIQRSTKQFHQRQVALSMDGARLRSVATVTKEAEKSQSELDELRVHIDFLTDRKDDVDRKIEGMTEQLREYAKESRKPSFADLLKARREPLLREADEFVDEGKNDSH